MTTSDRLKKAVDNIVFSILRGVSLGSDVIDEKIFKSEVDPALMLSFVKFAAEKMAETFGPTYKRLIIEYALKFESELLGERPPETIDDIEQLANYLLSRIEKHPKSYCALVYGMSKVDQLLQGGSGTARSVSASVLKKIFEDSGMLNQLIGSTANPYEALTKVEELLASIKANMPGEIVLQNLSNGNLRIIIRDCPYVDACKRMRSEGLWRPDGTPECYLLTRSTVIAEIITGKQYDYKVEELTPPERCSGYVHPI
ncbi:MAG: hypothetical protein ACTSWP_01105 [Candidatus Freyarchaeota archaeon]|nr:hypothetical protein [Candidatus Freyrarchaeum guaymaensis]